MLNLNTLQPQLFLDLESICMKLTQYSFKVVVH